MMYIYIYNPIEIQYAGAGTMLLLGYQYKTQDMSVRLVSSKYKKDGYGALTTHPNYEPLTDGDSDADLRDITLSIAKVGDQSPKYTM